MRQRANRWAVYTFVPLFVLFFAVLASQRGWIDPVAGTVVRRGPRAARAGPLP